MTGAEGRDDCRHVRRTDGRRWHGEYHQSSGKRLPGSHRRPIQDPSVRGGEPRRAACGSRCVRRPPFPTAATRPVSWGSNGRARGRPDPRSSLREACHRVWRHTSSGGSGHAPAATVSARVRAGAFPPRCTPAGRHGCPVVGEDGTRMTGLPISVHEGRSRSHNTRRNSQSCCDVFLTSCPLSG